MFDVNPAGKLAFAMLVSENRAGRVNIRLQKQPSGQQPVMAADRLINLSLAENLNNKPADSNPADSLAETRYAMQVDTFMKLTGASGVGQLIALIDSGVDAGHPDLQTTPQGYAKIVDYLDFTDEGRLSIEAGVEKTDDKINIAGHKVNVAGITNLADDFAYGHLDIGGFPIIVDGNTDTKRLVVAVAGKYNNWYDTVYVDTNGDGQILDEKAA